jgi:hypothetical protein
MAFDAGMDGDAGREKISPVSGVFFERWWRGGDVDKW